MSKEHHVVYIPGLRDQWFLNRNLARLLPLFWDRRGFPIHVVAPHWEQGESFEPKLKAITDEIDRLIEMGHRVSIIGQSAGGSAGLNAFAQRKDVLSKAINVTGRLRAGVNVKPTLEKAAYYSPAFRESVLLFENELGLTLTAEDRKRIMTLRPWWDEIVPASTVPLEGATNLVAPIPEHTLGGAYIMSLYSKVLQSFLMS